MKANSGELQLSLWRTLAIIALVLKSSGSINWHWSFVVLAVVVVFTIDLVRLSTAKGAQVDNEVDNEEVPLPPQKRSDGSECRI